MTDLSASYPSPKLGEKSLVRLGGALGIAATSICLLIFTVGCFGFSAAFTALPLIPLALAVVGMGSTLIGATIKKSASVEDTQTFAAMFVNLLGLAGALLEIAVWLNWNLFFSTATPGA
jgi:hypothetical protein